MTSTHHPLHSAESTPQGSGAPDVASGNVVLAVSFRLYKSILSPVLHAISPSRCLYLPTCSEYAYTAMQRFGFVRGSWMAVRRFARCHPWGKGGLDPVPDRVSSVNSGPPQSDPSGHNAPDHLP